MTESISLLENFFKSHSPSKERIAKLIAAYILSNQTGAFLEILSKASSEHRSMQSIAPLNEVNSSIEDDEIINLVNNLNRRLYKQYDKLIDEFEVDEDIAHECGRFIGSSIRDNSLLCFNVLDAERTYSAALLLKAAHAHFSLGYNLPILIATNDVEMRKHIVDDYIAEAREIKRLIDEAPPLEECERECLKDLDKKMMQVLEKKGELFD